MSHAPAPMPPPDLREHGKAADGSELTSNRRLFVQFLAFSGVTDPQPLIAALAALQTTPGVAPGALHAVLYADVHDPRGVGLVVATEHPALLVTQVRGLLQRPPFAALTLKPELGLLARTYAIGYEQDLDETLVRRPLRTLLNPAWTWAVWYPLRRNGAFAKLEAREQRGILGEHGAIGRAFGAADLAHDLRFACFGLDRDDNDFVVGLVGRELHPLSAVVQTMRGTRQTSEFIERLGPFFVGHVLWQSPG